MNKKNKYSIGINPCVYGMNYHNPSVVVSYNGELKYAIEEERLNRNKNSDGVFPELGLQEIRKKIS